MKEKIKNSEAGQIKLSDILKKGSFVVKRKIITDEEIMIISKTIQEQKKLLKPNFMSNSSIDEEIIKSRIKKEAIDFAAWKEQNQKPLPLEELYEQYLKQKTTI